MAFPKQGGTTNAKGRESILETVMWSTEAMTRHTECGSCGKHNIGGSAPKTQGEKKRNEHDGNESPRIKKAEIIISGWWEVRLLLSGLRQTL